MNSQIASVVTCPHCGTRNSVITSNLPLGTRLGCSHCREAIAHWRGPDQGFELHADAPQKEESGVQMGSLDEPA